jgi:hypothetical protein
VEAGWAGLVRGQGLVGREAGGWAWEKGGGPRVEEGERASRRPRPRRLG